jgi:mycocyclosin synthase
VTTAIDTGLLPDFPFSPRGDRLPDEIPALLRDRPVTRVRTIAGDVAWLVSSHALCKQVLEDGRFSLKETSAEGMPRQYALTIPPEVVNNMGNITGAGLRRAVMRAINPKAHADWLEQYAGELADRMLSDGAPADLRRDFTVPYSTGLHCRLLGIPMADADRLYRSLHVAFMNSPRPIPAAALNWDRDIAYMKDRLDDPATTGLMAELAALRGTPEYAHVSDDMFATVGVTMFGAGVISVMGALTMMCVTLLLDPEVRDRLAADPGLVPSAVDELLRVNLSIADGLPRIALDDVRLGDVTVAKGELVLVLVEAANHDPAQYQDPRAIRLDRPNAGTHLSFGGGGHYCPATALGKKHAEVALRALLHRMPRLDLAVPVEQLVWRTGFMKRVPERLPVRW